MAASSGVRSRLSRRPRVTEEMTFIGHLGELRRRVIICVIAVAVGACVGFTMWDWVLRVATQPYCQAQIDRGVDGGSCRLYITEPLQLVTTRMSVAGYLGLIFAAPVWLWQLWRFVTPGLHRNEKRYAVPFLVVSLALFSLGAAAAWFTFPKAMQFFLAVGGDHIETLFNPAPYLRLIFVMMLISGAVFEIPVLLVFLELVGVLTSKRLRSWRRYAVVVNFVVAAVATPSQDPYSLLALAVPMCVFYEVAILVGRVMKK